MEHVWDKLDLPPTQDASHHQVDITFLVGNPYKPSFATVTGWGVDPRDKYGISKPQQKSFNSHPGGDYPGGDSLPIYLQYLHHLLG